ncbi:hypothetical protein HK105_200877 [Polyrhizophydium stewartii]|uniref:Polysaccharide lyase 14 domain-containing protein n=1 Tax=Polyrhizophydium stewartii TaxID=2732419 RepID=A0ABR4NIF9_9FUNG|nr:hypothetical protein HK105_001008 [Polyrhizophydium stewartii]
MSQTAAALNLTSSTWTLDMAALAASSPLSSSAAWGAMQRFSGGSLSIAQDPTAPSSKVLQVSFPRGSYQSPTAANSGPSGGGAQFYFNPLGKNAGSLRALLEYDVYLAPNFEFNKGGKMPGLFGTDGSFGGVCDGSNQADGTTCWSVRLMWRAGGNGEAYGYIPVTQNDGICSSSNSYCSADFGTSISRGSFKLATSAWTSIGVYVQVNTPGKPDGSVAVYVNGNRALSFNNVVYRSSSVSDSNLLVRSVMFSNFYGGSTAEWASPTDTYMLYRNMRYSVSDVHMNGTRRPAAAKAVLIAALAAAVSLVLYL